MTVKTLALVVPGWHVLTTPSTRGTWHKPLNLRPTLHHWRFISREGFGDVIPVDYFSWESKEKIEFIIMNQRQYSSFDGLINDDGIYNGDFGNYKILREDNIDG